MAKEKFMENTFMQVEAMVEENGSTVISCRNAF